MDATISRRGFGIVMTGTLGALLATRLTAQAAPFERTGGVRAAKHASEPTYTLPALPYAYNALEPSIDELTMQIHHDKHHKAYVDNLNKAVADYPDLQKMEIKAIMTDLTVVPEKIRTAVRNNLGGHVNHSAFWLLMSSVNGAPSDQLMAAVTSKFGSLDAMKTAVNDAGLKRFGSGWTWLVVKGGALDVVSTANQDNPISDGLGAPILGIDVWEHAYYLKYQNKRADYLAAWWKVVNWETVNGGFNEAK